MTANDMRILSLTQPWASFMAWGLKHIETRSWGTPYRGPVLIHAAKGFPGWAQALCDHEWFAPHLAAMGLGASTLPLGVVLCKVELMDCVRTDWLLNSATDAARRLRIEFLDPALPEEDMGDYAPGRWAWITRGLVRFEQPIPARGAQGLRAPAPEVWQAAELVMSV